MPIHKIPPRSIRYLAVFMLVILGGCASSREKATDLAHDAGWQWTIISTGTFDLATARPSERRGQTLWVYIEGDGFAFRTPTDPSSDPTPSDPIALRLALAHPGSNPVAYIARPCQFVLPDRGRNCKQDYWTNARYAPEVVDSVNQAIDVLEKETGASQLILAGYSGGGSLALLAAAKRKDVAGLVTVAANLDLAYWTKRDGLTPLTGSLDPADAAYAVASIPQIHFTGASDEVVGTDVVQAFLVRLPPGSPVRVIKMPGFTHSCCWADHWKELVESPAVTGILAHQ